MNAGSVILSLVKASPDDFLAGLKSLSNQERVEVDRKMRQLEDKHQSEFSQDSGRREQSRRGFLSTLGLGAAGIGAAIGAKLLPGGKVIGEQAPKAAPPAAAAPDPRQVLRRQSFSNPVREDDLPGLANFYHSKEVGRGSWVKDEERNVLPLAGHITRRLAPTRISEKNKYPRVYETHGGVFDDRGEVITPSRMLYHRLQDKDLTRDQMAEALRFTRMSLEDVRQARIELEEDTYPVRDSHLLHSGDIDTGEFLDEETLEKVRNDEYPRDYHGLTEPEREAVERVDKDAARAMEKYGGGGYSNHDDYEKLETREKLLDQEFKSLEGIRGRVKAAIKHRLDSEQKFGGTGDIPTRDHGGDALDHEEHLLMNDVPLSEEELTNLKTSRESFFEKYGVTDE